MAKTYIRCQPLKKFWDTVHVLMFKCKFGKFGSPLIGITTRGSRRHIWNEICGKTVENLKSTIIWTQHTSALTAKSRVENTLEHLKSQCEAHQFHLMRVEWINGKCFLEYAVKKEQMNKIYDRELLTLVTGIGLLMCLRKRLKFWYHTEKGFWNIFQK